MKLMGPVTVKESETSRKNTDMRGVFIEVKEGDAIPQGYGTAIRYVVTRNFASTKVLTQNNRILRWDERSEAEQFLNKLPK